VTDFCQQVFLGATKGPEFLTLHEKVFWEVDADQFFLEFLFFCNFQKKI